MNNYLPYQIKLSPYAKIFYTEWLLDPRSYRYNVSYAQILHGELNECRLRKALIRYINDHLLLNSHIQDINGEPYWIKNSYIEELEYIDYPLDDTELLSYATKSFDLYNGPLYRFKLIRLSDNKYKFIVVLHHLVMDGSSLDVGVFDTISNYYNDENYKIIYSIDDQIKLITNLTAKLVDNLELNRNKCKEFWSQQLTDIEENIDLTFLKLENQFKDIATSESPIQEIRFSCDKEQVNKLNQLKLRYSVTPYIYGQCIFALLLHKYTGQKKLAISYPIAIKEEIDFVYGAQLNINLIPYRFNNITTILDLLNQSREFFYLIKQENIKYSYYPLPELFCSLNFNNQLLKTSFIQAPFRDKPFIFNGIEKVDVLSELNVDSVPLEMLLFEQEIKLRDSKLNYRVRYDKRSFDKMLVDNFIATYIRLFNEILDDLLHDNIKKTTDYLLLTKEQYQQIVYDWNKAERPYPKDKTIHQLFEEQVLKTPNNIAVSSEQKQYTYLELSKLTNQMAYELLKLGAEVNTLVAIVMEKGWEQVVAVLSILKSGAAYLPIDPDDSIDRLGYLLKHNDIDIVLTQSKFKELFNSFNLKRIVYIDACYEEVKSNISFLELQNLTKQKEVDLAYVIYTSGSTGIPKGVMITHKNVINTIFDINCRFKVSEKDKIYALSSLNFDLSVYDIFGALFSGATIIIPRNTFIKDPLYWAQQLLMEKITIWNSVPMHFQMLTEYLINRNLFKQDLNKESLRLVLLSGDWIPVHLPAIAKKIFPNAKFVSLGGATEASIWSILYPIRDVNPNWKSIPYGKPMENQYFYIYDENLTEIKDGEIGELYIGGDGVAKGYWKDDDLTNKKFIVHPKTKEYLYKTGDLGRFLPDNNIEFLGRADYQIKIGGYRIDILGLEKILSTHPLIKQVIVAPVKQENRYVNLQAYTVVNDSAIHSNISKELSLAQIDRWHDIYQNINQDNKTELSNTAGWFSSYTGKPFSVHEMTEWVNNTVNRILLFTPQKVLEIGCGLGLLLFKLIPYCKKYTGTDFSENALKFIRSKYISINNGIDIELLCREAVNFQNLKKEFDTVIINSVAQYFPSIDYLNEVVEKSIEIINDSGQIFIGDVRNLNTVTNFYNSLILYKYPNLNSNELLQLYVQDKFNREKELLISPKYFYYLATKNNKISSIEIMPKEGKYYNEMNRFRYDVVLHINKKSKDSLCNKANCFIGEESEENCYNSPLKSTSFKIIENQLRQLLTNNFPNYVNISSFFFIDKIPLTQNNKINRGIFHTLGATSNQKHISPRTITEKKLLKIWEKILNITTISVEDDFNILGIDSLGVVCIMNSVEKMFSIKLSLEEIRKLQTVSLIAKEIDNLTT